MHFLRNDFVIVSGRHTMRCLRTLFDDRSASSRRRRSYDRVLRTRSRARTRARHRELAARRRRRWGDWTLPMLVGHLCDSRLHAVDHLLAGDVLRRALAHTHTHTHTRTQARCLLRTCAPTRVRAIFSWFSTMCTQHTHEQYDGDCANRSRESLLKRTRRAADEGARVCASMCASVSASACSICASCAAGMNNLYGAYERGWSEARRVGVECDATKHVAMER